MMIISHVDMFPIYFRSKQFLYEKERRNSNSKGSLALSNITRMSGKLGQYSQCDDLITATLSHNSAMPPTLLRSFFSTLLLIASDVLATGVNIYENGIFYFYSCYYKMERFMDFMMTPVLHCMMRIFTLLHGPT